MTEPVLINESNLSSAWVSVLKYVVEKPGIEICPLVLSLTHFEENDRTRKILDHSLIEDNFSSIQTVSETIFPKSLYEFCCYDRQLLYKEYLRNIPRIKSIDKRSNGRGTYFERLIAFDGQKSKINQLEIIINSILEGKIKRRSKLQASVFNPEKDHTNGMYQGFPCLQHISFYKTAQNGLVLNSFYAIQYLYKRAYGNWLGLINLGKFVASELNIELERFNCYIGVEKLDHLKKTDARILLENLDKT